MLHNRDYILRLIEQLGRALNQIVAQILGRSGDGPIDVDAELQGLALQAGLDLDLATRLSVETLPMLVAPLGTPDPGRTWLLAELLYLRGFQAEHRAEPERARDCYRRSLELYRLVEPEWETEIGLPAPTDRIAELRQRLGNDPSA